LHHFSNQKWARDIPKEVANTWPWSKQANTQNLLEMGHDPTQVYFWAALNKRPTRLWPGYFLTRPGSKKISYYPSLELIPNIIFTFPPRRANTSKVCHGMQLAGGTIKAWLLVARIVYFSSFTQRSSVTNWALTLKVKCWELKSWKFLSTWKKLIPEMMVHPSRWTKLHSYHHSNTFD